MPTNPTAPTALPTPPSTTDPTNFDSRADNFLGALPTFQTQTNALAVVTYNNAVEAATSATNANTSAGNASTSAGNAATSATNANNSATSAATYAQAAQAASGVPAPSVGQLTSDGTNVFWSNTGDANKLDKVAGVASKLSYTYVDGGTISSGGTYTANALTATVHRVQAAGSLTLAFSNMVTGSVSSDIELLCVNFGGKTITWPAGNWIKADGSYAAAVSNSGVTWQTSGTDRVLVMVDNGAITYKVMR